MQRPRTTESVKVSASAPPTTLIGGLPNVPAKKRNAKKADQQGAAAEASVARLKRTNPPSSTGRRPTCSDNGAKTSGPQTKPARKTDEGRTV